MQTFIINDVELRAAEKWIKEQKDKYGSGGSSRFSYIFTPTAIGDAVSIRDSLTGKEKDITDYSNW